MFTLKRAWRGFKLGLSADLVLVALILGPVFVLSILNSGSGHCFGFFTTGRPCNNIEIVLDTFQVTYSILFETWLQFTLFVMLLMPVLGAVSHAVKPDPIDILEQDPRVSPERAPRPSILTIVLATAAIVLVASIFVLPIGEIIGPPLTGYVLRSDQVSPIGGAALLVLTLGALYGLARGIYRSITRTRT